MSDMFVPGFATVLRLLDGDTMARRSGVQMGDVFVAVNGEGFRRFPPEVEDPSDANLDEGEKVLKNTVVKEGEGYAGLMGKIKAVKGAGDPEQPLVLSLERYGWDEPPNAWERFLKARNGDVPAAMAMRQKHEAWRNETFPMDLKNSAVRDILRSKSVSELDFKGNDSIPCVYVDYAKLQALSSDSVDSVVQSFIAMTEVILKKSSDPRTPKASQFIDLSHVTITGGMRSDILRKIYGVFEPNYPETLHRMVMYPVSSIVRRTASIMLSFVNENTAAKFVITDKIDVVCKELGWPKEEVDACGGITEFVAKHCMPNEELIHDE